MGAHEDGWHPPPEIDEYVVLHPLGRGTMGRVFAAYDTVLARHVAVKILDATGDEARGRFLVEARAAARIQHPNVVAVHRVGELEGRPYLISELVRGRRLDEIGRPIPWRRALEIAVGLARGLAAAHRSGILHRDINPGNAMLADDGHAKLLDFGLAKVGAAPRAQSPDAAVLAGAPARSTGTDTVPPPGWNDPRGAPLPAAQGAEARHQGILTPSAFERRDASRTHAGAIFGTPNYLAPERWRGEDATARSDVYSLGVVLYELCSDTVPFEGSCADSYRRAMDASEAAPLESRVPEVDARFASIVNRCLRRDPEARFESARELLLALEGVQQALAGVATPSGNPYRGLRAFEREHRALFFGRGAEVAAVLDRLRTERVVCVTSDSGVGKSSLCRAGVLPLVEGGALCGPQEPPHHEGNPETSGPRVSGAWAIASCFPGRQPLRALHEAIAAALGWDDPAPLAHLGRRVRAHLGEALGLVLFIDQIEELCTVAEPREADLAERALRELLASPRVRLLATARADFLTRLAGLPALGSEISRGLFVLRAMSADAIREAVVGPAAAKGMRFESDAMIEELVASASSGAGGLPLLEFTLAELWEARDQTRAVIPRAALTAVGGVRGALERHADSVLATLRPGERTAARGILTHLVSAEGLRVRRSHAELTRELPDATVGLDALVRGRLVVAFDDADGAAYEIAHEALVDGWRQLREWLREDEGIRAAQDRLARAADEWARLGRAREALWGVRQLAEARALEDVVLPRRDREFLERSRRRVARERTRWAAAIVALPVAALIAYLVTTWSSARDREHAIDAHVARFRAAFDRARTVIPAYLEGRARALRRFDRQEREEGEKLWGKARAMGATVRGALAEAGHHLEAALVLEGARTDLRVSFADVTLERALHAEREGDAAARDELAARLALYDPDGSRRGRLFEPASVSLRTDPIDAQVALSRYVERGGVLVLEPVSGVRADSAMSLPGGSYRLLLTAKGRAPVRYPFLVRRGERLDLRIELPRAESIPKGFVYVAPGRFLFGSAAEDELRRGFFETAPLHEITTAGYLIQENETTIDEWIRFLEELPAVERERRTPRAAAAGISGAVSLVRRASGWELRVQPGKLPYHARDGEALVYRARDKRASQNWRRLPVTGIDAHDATVYAAWLARTGRAPGARLCTELEWERAARGADAREFPHGDRLAPDDANFDETYGKVADATGPDEVGSYPRSRSPFGVNDLVGNAFEWTRSSLEKDAFVGRGGSASFERNTSKATNRHRTPPTLREATVGVRVCADAPPP
jgi:serine/threonine protein kinase/formylglycine-generating enzyme required for sulfatase activity